jgi:hypothetical protein
MFLVYPSQFAGTNQATATGFGVDDVEKSVEELAGKGITFEEFDLPWGKTVERGFADGEWRGAFSRIRRATSCPSGSLRTRKQRCRRADWPIEFKETFADPRPWRCAIPGCVARSPRVTHYGAPHPRQPLPVTPAGDAQDAPIPRVGPAIE